MRGLKLAASLSMLPDFSETLGKVDPREELQVVPFTRASQKDARFVELFVYLRSNWGHPNLISLSAIAVLNEKNVSLPVKTIAVLPASAEPGIENLCKGGIIKSEAAKAWVAPFDAERGVCIKLTLNAFPVPQAVRFWNGSSKDDARAVKEFDVFFGNIFACTGQLNPTFGAVHSLCQDPSSGIPDHCRKVIESLMPPGEVTYADEWGVMPVVPVERVDIVVHETYSPDGGIGLNTVQFFDINDQLIDLPDSAAIESENVMSHCSMRSICMPDAVKADQEIWNGTIVTGRTPALKISLGKKYRLRKIRIFNHYLLNGGENLGLKRVTIRLNGVTFWSGVLPSGDRPSFSLNLVDERPGKAMPQVPPGQTPDMVGLLA
jgi:hypothetical protein